MDKDQKAYYLTRKDAYVACGEVEVLSKYAAKLGQRSSQPV